MAGLEGKIRARGSGAPASWQGRRRPREIETLRAGMTAAEKRKLVKDTRFGVDWIYEVANRIAEKRA
jgi:hypothetical protein